MRASSSCIDTPCTLIMGLSMFEGMPIWALVRLPFVHSISIRYPFRAANPEILPSGHSVG